SKLHTLPRIAAAAILLVVVMHFAATLLYLTPLNPVKAAVYTQLNRYMEPYFTQNWAMFAPDPVADTTLLLVSCRMAEANGAAETPWIDVTSRLRELHYRYRITPADRIARAESAPLLLMARRPDLLVETIKKLPTERDPEVARTQRAIDEANEASY